APGGAENSLQPLLQLLDGSLYCAVYFGCRVFASLRQGWRLFKRIRRFLQSLPGSFVNGLPRRATVASGRSEQSGQFSSVSSRRDHVGSLFQEFIPVCVIVEE